MQIRKYNELPQEMKDRLNDANIFFQSNFAEFVHQNNEQMWFVYNDERIVPIRHRKKAMFNLGVFVSEPYLFTDMPLESEGDFMENAVTVASKKLHIQWIHSTAACFFYDTPRTKCKRIPFGSHVIDLSLTDEELWKNVHSKHRNVIRKAEKESVLIKKGREELVDDYAMLERETQVRTGRKASGRNYYDKQIKYLKDNIIVYIAYKDGKPQAGGIFYFNKQR